MNKQSHNLVGAICSFCISSHIIQYSKLHTHIRIDILFKNYTLTALMRRLLFLLVCTLWTLFIIGVRLAVRFLDGHLVCD